MGLIEGNENSKEYLINKLVWFNNNSLTHILWTLQKAYTLFARNMSYIAIDKTSKHSLQSVIHISSQKIKIKHCQIEKQGCRVNHGACCK